MAGGSNKTGKRPFWAHQLVEYILGGALVASGLQTQTPVMPAVVGGFLLLYAGATRGALAAFRLIDRRVHRVADPVLVVVQIGAALQPWVSVDNGTRVIMIGIAVVHLVVWLGSSFTQKEKRVSAASTDPSADRSTELGRSAGRLAAKGVRAVRTAKANRAGK
ncbi:MAG: hypothetical protein K8R99_07995 [Actinomycetia bacterium]|nr:hypothetical protein [Actinomycetes bacterium]